MFAQEKCVGLNEKCPPIVEGIGHMVSSWWRYLVKLGELALLDEICY